MMRPRLLALLVLPAFAIAQDNGRSDRLSIVTRAQYDAQRAGNRESLVGFRKAGTIRFIVLDVREQAASRATRKRAVERLQATGMRVMDLSEGGVAWRTSDGKLPLLHVSVVPDDHGVRQTGPGTLYAQMNESATLPRNGRSFSVATWHYADEVSPNPEGSVRYGAPKEIDARVDRIVDQFVEDFKASNE